MTDATLQQVVTAVGPSQVLDISYHMSWPNGSDPFYVYNNADNNARRSYYGVNGLPTMKCDGSPVAPYYSDLANAINYRLSIPSPLWMDINGTVIGDSLFVSCRVVADQEISGNYALHLALMDQYTYIVSPNGNPHHYHDLYDLSPSGSGQAFSATAFDTTTYSASFYLEPDWLLMNLDMACFVQNNANREILQATFDHIPLEYPSIQLSDYALDDVGGNNDGRVEAGESGALTVTLQNQLYFNDATLVVATLLTDEPQISITQPTFQLVALGSGASATNNANPFAFDVDAAFETKEVGFTVSVYSEPGGNTSNFPLTFMIGRPDYLLVNDDTNGGYQSWYETALDSLELIYDVWNQAQAGAISEAELLHYEVVIWYTGAASSQTLTADEQTRLQNYLQNGGNLLLSSQNSGDEIGGSAFYSDVLHAQHLSSSTGEYLLNGVSGDPITDGTSVTLVGSGGAGNANSCNSLTPLAPATAIFTYQNAATPGALRCETRNGRLVFCAFPVEALSGAMSSLTRTQFLALALEWLEGVTAVAPEADAATLPTEFAISRICPNPFNPATQIEFTLPSANAVKLAIYDLQGKLVAELLNSQLPAGVHQLSWEAGNLPSGVYLITLTAGSQTVTRKAVLLK